MKAQLANGLWGVLDYATYPAGLLIVAPVMLRHLGTERYGIWMMAAAVSMTGGVLASGLGDANIQITATKRAAGDAGGVVRAVQNTLGLHLLLGSTIGGIAWVLSPWMALHASSGVYADQLWSLRIAGVFVLIRAIETVWVSTLRALARYGDAYLYSGACRVLGLAAGVSASYVTTSIAALMCILLLISVVTVWMQKKQVERALNVSGLRPRLERAVVWPLLRFGSFTWLQTVSTLLFAQADRLLVGILLGAAQVTAYSLCAQITQPVYGIAAAGLHTIFPHIASRSSHEAVQRATLRALSVNLAFVAGGVLLILVSGPMLLSWMVGPELATASAALLRTMLTASALAGLSVTGSYVMLALGRPRTVCMLAVVATVAGATVMLTMARTHDASGVAFGRELYGVIVLLIYLPLFGCLRTRSRTTPSVASWGDA